MTFHFGIGGFWWYLSNDVIYIRWFRSDIVETRDSNECLPRGTKKGLPQ